MSIIGSCIFLILIFTGMIIYDGGNRFDHLAKNYSFTKNYLSELGRIETFDGRSNLIPRILFTSALSFGGIGLVLFYSYFPTIFQKNSKVWKICLAGSIFGILSSIFCISIGYVPMDINIAIHRACTGTFAFLAIPSQILLGSAILMEKNYSNFYGGLFINFGFFMFCYILLWFIFKFDSPYYQEIIKIIGQKLVIFINSVIVIIQSYGTKQHFLYPIDQNKNQEIEIID